MYQRILVPLDGSACAWRGLAEAIRIGAVSGGQLRLVHVLDIHPPSRDAQITMLDACREQAIKAGVQAETALLDPFDGSLADQVVADARAWSADLIVAGTHGRKGLTRAALGSDAERIVRGSPVPVLLVPAALAPAVAQPF